LFLLQKFARTIRAARLPMARAFANLGLLLLVGIGSEDAREALRQPALL